MMQDARQAARDRRKADDREILRGQQAGQAGCRHLAAADAGELQRHAGALLQRPHQCAAEPVAGFLDGDQKNLELTPALDSLGLAVSGRPAAICRAVGGAHATGAPEASAPATNSFARSAAAAINAGSATMVEPAITATPASPSAAAPSIV